MTWPAPPRPLEDVAVFVFAFAMMTVLVWLCSPVFNYLMRVLQ